MYIASIAADVKIHSWPAGQLVNTYKASGHGVIRTISWGKDGNWLVIVPTQGPAEIIAIRENILKHLYTIDDIQQPTCAVFQNLTKRNVALGTNTGNVLVYDIKTRSVRKHFPRAMSTVFRVEYGMKDNYLLAACENGEILTFNSSTMNCSASYKIPKTKSVSTIRTNIYLRNLFMAGSEEGVVAVWDIHRSSVIHKNITHQAIVTDVSFSPIRHDLIVSCGLDRKFVFWDTTSNSVVLQKLMDRSPTSIDFCPDGVGLAVGTQAGSIYTYDTRRMNDPMYVFKAHHSFVKQLLFQKCNSEDSGDFGTLLLNQECGDTAAVVRAMEPPMVTGFDSFGSMLCDITTPNPEPPEVQPGRDSGSDIQQDSFLDAMGFMTNSLRENSHCGPITKGVRKLLNSKPHLLESVMGDNSPNASMEYDRIQQNREPNLRKMKDNLRESRRNNTDYQESIHSPPKDAPREYSREECANSGRRENGDIHRRDNSVREGRQQCYDRCPSPRRRSDYTDDVRNHQRRESIEEHPAHQQRTTQEDHYSQGEQSLPVPTLKHRQLERIAQSPELRYQNNCEEHQAASNPTDTIKGHSQRNSTPKGVTVTTAKTPVPMHISPIISQSSTRQAEITDFHNTVRQVVKQEVKDQLDTFHQSLKYDIMEVLAQIRRNFLDMQMSIVKEFVQLESSLNKVREDLANDEGLSDEVLLQENMRLRKELAMLREQVIRHKDQ